MKSLLLVQYQPRPLGCYCFCKKKMLFVEPLGCLAQFMYISVASIIRVAVEYFLEKHSGRCNFTISLEGNRSSSLNLKKIT